MNAEVRLQLLAHHQSTHLILITVYRLCMLHSKLVLASDDFRFLADRKHIAIGFGLLEGIYFIHVYNMHVYYNTM